ncbi:MAG: hypothetical protein U1E76_22000 [Planctomycetota bacterium]
MKIDALKKLLTLPKKTLERCTRSHPEAAVVWDGLIVKEFMEARGIESVTTGVREFYAFKRREIAKLGLRKAS